MDTITHQQREGIGLKLFRIVFIVISLIIALFLIPKGFKLYQLGGTSYYLIAGIAYLLIALLYAIRHKTALVLSCLCYLGTIIWAFYEVRAFDYWQLVARLVVPTILWVLSLWLSRSLKSQQRFTGIANLVGVAGFLGLVATFVAAFFPHGVIRNQLDIQQKPELAKVNPANPENWEYFGRNSNSTRFAPFTDITPENVKDLQVAWTYRTGRPTEIGVDENTPIQIGDVLYSCTPTNIITAIDADSGKALWTFDPKARTEEHVTCRGVAYHDADRAAGVTANQTANQTVSNTTETLSQSAAKVCRQRILTSTVDGRLIALDAKTGKLCPDFGHAGQVDVLRDMGPTEQSKRYHPTATPVIVGHVALIGGWVRDIVHGEPSGVVRAYDVTTGHLAWAWDVGNPENSGVPTDGKTFTLETPNVWAVPSFDTDLNLVYLPTGNGPPDYWGGDRNAAKEKFGSAIVAVDADTGKTRWVFQTVHHDVWDYDVPSQPILHDITNAEGKTVPALIQTTKTGQIFVLDRRTGEPVMPVEERAVPTSPHSQGEKLAPTQPFSVGMPSIGVEDLKETDMWGMSTFDQLMCRIDFKDSVYTGMYTPPSEKSYIEWPGLLGGMNWGGAAIDESTNLMYVNDMRMPIRMRLVKQEEAKQYKVSTDEVPGFMGTIRPQIAGIYGGVKIDILQSPLGVPCNKPPFGTMSAIDLNSKKMLWQVPMGTVKDSGPLGIKTHLPIPVGMPTLGGPTATASGLVFFAGTQDYYLRAMDARTGKELWKARLPVGVVSAPLVYKSPKTGKQYVVVSAGGVSHSKDLGDYIIAYALPDHK
ncbi:membrane-bound PQQ-dependent dehydrogenase, glucose/quinate/shikimate family [Acinetobacter larvae]|uniref:Pyrroloquinoline quinone-dependent dehydrogenase n=1 Tax=Acinetobacter larvae TaxID=1789224 RepID=A0A1B2M1B2_9GAMM|nr:membrane-bound PQQ-dependent dehydrogenase, glucose/quinate/shikimate family [Acinetobacter larvae]AOA58941.1 pyrroloquinoline quinone-dependent dehydrogenase [Acinetobacter larvae]